jgi:hypothetical protein
VQLAEAGGPNVEMVLSLLQPMVVGIFHHLQTTGGWHFRALQHNSKVMS